MQDIKKSPLRKNPEKIRNVGVIAHVDHGKTTLCDHLLADAGLMAKSLAGEARTLDFLPDEQERGITIESSIISFLISHEQEEYLLNLIDTPGHVDFSGKVAEALYIVDGALVVVDAVEGVMAQTEVVLRQALKEKIVPVVVINKVDRLFTELMLPNEKIQEQLQYIVDRINSILYEGFKGKYKIDFSKGNLILASALHGWGINYHDLLESKSVMSEIKNAYEKGTTSKLSSKYPLSNKIFDMIINKIPPPNKRQKALVELKKKQTEGDKFVAECSSINPLIAVAGKIHEISYLQFVSIVRIMSGTLKVGDKLKNQRTKQELRTDNIYLIQGNKAISIKKAYPGEVVGIVMKNLALPGDTLTDPKLDYNFYYGVEYIQEPIMSISIEPKNLKQLNRLVKHLENLTFAIPNLDLEINQETGEIQLHGVGALQLELVLKRLDDDGIAVYSSHPQVTYYEIPQKETNFEFTSPVNIIIKGKIIPSGNKKKINHNYKLLVKDKRDNELYLDKTLKISEELKDAIVDGFKIASQFGPLRRYRVRNTTLLIDSIEIEENSSYEDMLISIRGFIHQGLREADVSIFEPVFEFRVITPTDWLGQVLTVLERNSAKIKHVESYSKDSVVTGTIPVTYAKSLGSELRDASEGRATIILKISGYEPLIA